jgi:3-dehydroquinate synthase
MTAAMDRLTIQSRLGAYDVEVHDEDAWVGELASLDDAVFVVDDLVWELHAAGVLGPLAPRDPVRVAATEETKTLEGVAALCDALLKRSAKRGSTVISIGGGVVQDATGFLASVMFRGMRWIYIPTTLLAQADSCIGGKTSINFGGFKNLLGTFYPPQRVIVHPPFADTLDDHQYASGLGEIVKMHIAGGPASIQRLEAAVPALFRRGDRTLTGAVHESLRIKQAFIEEDEFDTGRRQLLNFGHCFGHAIESATDFAVPHGQGVALGMILAGLVAVARGQLTDGGLDAYTRRHFVPTLTESANVDRLDHDAVIEAMRRDKKRSGPGLAVVLPDESWALSVARDITEAEARRALARLPTLLDGTPARS